MKNFADWFARTDARIARWMAHHGVRLLHISVGVIFFWFGVLKFFPTSAPRNNWRRTRRAR